MPHPLVYEVAPASQGWVVRIAGDSQSEGFELKADAVARARQLAHGQRAMVRVLTESGRVEAEFGPSGART